MATAITTAELTEMIKERDSVIYGTGFVAGMLFEALSFRGISSGVKAFCKTDPPSPGESFRELPVVRFEDIDGAGGAQDPLILIAVHETVAGEITERIEKSGRTAVWVYPYLTELLYGAPLCVDTLSVSGIISKQDPSYNWLAVRYALLEADDGPEREAAENLYLKAVSMHTSRSTAEKRLAAFRSLTDSIEKDGYREDSFISIDTDGRIIDGLHRIAACRFYGIGSIPAKVYETSPMFDRVIRPENRMDEKTLKDGGITDDEMEIIRKAKSEMMESGS